MALEPAVPHRDRLPRGFEPLAGILGEKRVVEEDTDG